MFSAVSNLGAGGTQDTALSDISNGVLYGMFALTGLVSGGINNRACFFLFDPMIVGYEFDCLLIHSTWTPSDTFYWLTRLLAVHRLIVVVSLRHAIPIRAQDERSAHVD